MKFAEFINRLMRSFSIYKGILLGLAGIWLVALVLSFVGLLSFSPLALVVSTLVLVLSTYVTSVLCAKLFGLKAYGESSLITGLILSLIVFPATGIPQLVVLLFIGMIAGASKFIVTWRGRHIFNPAAFAVVVIGLTGLGSAAWWVATPILTPIVLAVVLLSLYESKRFSVVGIFLAIAIPGILIQCLLLGATFGEGLVLLLSWPILFLAGVMLTEPLTLPPRKWQMYTVAVVVALLFVVPLQIGPFQMSPALALLVGNVLAAVFASRRVIELTFKKRQSLTPTTDELIFSPSAKVSYTPGQFMEVTLPHKKADFRGTRRGFSMTSIPSEKDISFGIKFYEPSSTFKKALRTLKPGDVIQATQISGDFILPKDTSRPLLFVVGGIGITPCISHIKSLKASTRDIVLVYSVNSPEEIAYRQILEESGIRVIIVSSKKPTVLAKDWVYSSNARIDYDTLSELVPDISLRWAYTSGPVPFVQTAKHNLRKLGVRSVKSDYFAGY
ncbi:MAG: ferredoxin--NADP reductase [Candidatus Saccharimonadaceae bacterium]